MKKADRQRLEVLWAEREEQVYEDIRVEACEAGKTIRYPRPTALDGRTLYSTEDGWFEANGQRFRLWLPEDAPPFPWEDVHLTIDVEKGLPAAPDPADAHEAFMEDYRYELTEAGKALMDDMIVPRGLAVKLTEEQGEELVRDWNRIVFGPAPHREPARLVALSGLAGAGKDTAAEVLVAQGWVVGKFAAPLYAAVEVLNPYVTHSGQRLSHLLGLFGWDHVKRNYPEVRRLLQVMGTEIGRDIIGEDTWIDAAHRWRCEQDAPIVFTDARFPNEIEYIRNQGGVWVHIIRPGQATEGAGHASESSLPDPYDGPAGADLILYNDGSVAKLQAHFAEFVHCM